VTFSSTKCSISAIGDVVRQFLPSGEIECDVAHIFTPVAPSGTSDASQHGDQRGKGLSTMNAVMSTNEPMLRHHDLLIEMGSLEMAMEKLNERNQAEQGRLRPRIEQRLAHIRETLAGLND
jgi:hypothetical protein